MINFNTRKIFNIYFNGQKNFITPNVYSYGHKRWGNQILLFEKSYGKGLYDIDLYGITFLKFNENTNECQRIDLSKSFGSKDELDKYLNTIDKETFENADVYGEIRKIWS